VLRYIEENETLNIWRQTEARAQIKEFQVKYICIKRLKIQVNTQCTEVDSFVISLSWGKKLDLAGAQIHLRAPNSMRVVNHNTDAWLETIGNKLNPSLSLAITCD
jgi:hypothetical protein